MKHAVVEALEATKTKDRSKNSGGLIYLTYRNEEVALGFGHETAVVVTASVFAAVSAWIFVLQFKFLDFFDFGLVVFE